MTNILITMISSGVITAIGDEVCSSLGRGDIAKWVRVGGISLTAGLGIGLVIKLVNQVKSAFAM